MQRTRCYPILKTSRLMFRGTIDVYSENRTKHLNTLRGQNAVMLNVKAGDTYTSVFTTSLDTIDPQFLLPWVAVNPHPSAPHVPGVA
jgi:hypothetical protein